ncbi:MAG TPA: RNA 3'-terminal phosphate cyclase [Chthonomonadaceae bacterium]|nr:RNA 3'-terminal phosphate cyclase [Chthonomonadaceae bacterium]
MEKESRAAAPEVVEIDGSFGEGGGQILRTSVSLAAITGRPVQIANIRARRSKPGLQPQHLTAVRAAAALCDAELRGAEPGSQFLRFTPGPLVDRDSFDFDVGTAGATGLVAQTLLVPMLYLPKRPATATIRGGTHVPMSPPADYIETVYRPVLHRLGVDIGFRMARAGFFPRGGGKVALTVGEGALINPVDLTERGRLQRMRLFVVTCQLPVHVADRGVDTLMRDLRGYGVPVIVEKRALEGGNPGAAVVIVAEFENGMGGWTSLGERGKPMERVATEALRDFQKWFGSQAAVDEHLADQLVLPCSLIVGESRWSTPSITEHLRTVLFVAQRFLPIEYTVEELPGGGGRVTLRGAGPGARYAAIR